jgi:hypothetical protein
MSKRCELQKEYYQANGNYKGSGKYSDDYVMWLENEVLALRQPPVSGSLQDRLFELANDFAVAKKGEVAVKLHSIHNGLQ